MSDALISRFINDEATPHVVSTLIKALSDGGEGSKYFTFNSCNVLLDFDLSLATIEDELDPESQVSIPLLQFSQLLAEAGSC